MFMCLCVCTGVYTYRYIRRTFCRNINERGRAVTTTLQIHDYVTSSLPRYDTKKFAATVRKKSRYYYVITTLLHYDYTTSLLLLYYNETFAATVRKKRAFPSSGSGPSR